MSEEYLLLCVDFAFILGWLIPYEMGTGPKCDYPLASNISSKYSLLWYVLHWLLLEAWHSLTRTSAAFSHYM
jgi:hypothetical protein